MPCNIAGMTIRPWNIVEEARSYGLIVIQVTVIEVSAMQVPTIQVSVTEVLNNCDTEP